jgi:hypothetical protein
VALGTFSVFYYGHEVTVENNMIPFDEGAGELTAELDVGFYSLTEYAAEVASAMNDVGDNTYSVSVNRVTRILTVSADANFDLLFLSGAAASVSARELMGFEAADFTGDDSYTATIQSGEEYRPQFLLQDYVSKDDNLTLVDAVVNKAANGRVQVIRFGDERFFKMNIKYITDHAMDGVVIKNNPTGVDDARAFMDSIVKKATFEFMPNKSSTSTFYKVLLESTPLDKNGTAYELKELVNQDLPGIYETGLLKLRLME